MWVAGKGVGEGWHSNLTVIMSPNIKRKEDVAVFLELNCAIQGDIDVSVEVARTRKMGVS